MHSFLTVIGEAGLLFASVARTVVRGRFSWREVIVQSYEMANRSLFFLTVTMGFIGAILIIQALIQAQRVVGDVSTIGAGFLDLLVQLFAPTISAMMIATRVGAGIAAHIGTMSVTEQNDALRLCGADPVSFLVTPRVVAGFLLMPCLAIWGGTIAYAASGFVAHHDFGIAYDVYFSTYLVSRRDVITGLAKAFMHGGAITLISSFFGLRAYGGSAGVGRATTLAVLGSSLAILILDFLIGGISYLFR